MIELELKQFIFLYFVQFDLLPTVVAIHLTHHYSGVNKDLTIAISFRPKASSSFFLPQGFIKYRRRQNNVWSFAVSDYVHKTANQLWIENSELTGLKDCKSCQGNVSVSLEKRKQHRKKKKKKKKERKKKQEKKMNASFLTYQVRSCRLSYTSQLAEEASFFSITLF